ncbi:MerR family transcriptional regulator [Streptomyces caniferus]|uniref:MerR family transcriptional regulator n=1 Tax=Streptomyces caniferus TaxID=285557 RepID=UPI002E2D633C|nr:MerR family transcriptional regulator [Streptomyces caniferus]
MRIGDAAAAAGMTPRALRYYEQQGLVTARRAPSGHRVYDEEDIRRLRVVRELRDAGLTVGDVRTFAPLLRTMPAGGVPDLIPRATGPGRCPAVEAVARRRLADLDARIERLSQLRARLAARLGEPGAGAPAPTAPEAPAGPDGPATAARAGADSGPIFRLDGAPARAPAPAPASPPPPGPPALRA